MEKLSLKLLKSIASFFGVRLVKTQDYDLSERIRVLRFDHNGEPWCYGIGSRKVSLLPDGETPDGEYVDSWIDL